MIIQQLKSQKAWPHGIRIMKLKILEEGVRRIKAARRRHLCRGPTMTTISRAISQAHLRVSLLLLLNKSGPSRLVMRIQLSMHKKVRTMGLWIKMRKMATGLPCNPWVLTTTKRARLQWATMLESVDQTQATMGPISYRNPVPGAKMRQKTTATSWATMVEIRTVQRWDSRNRQSHSWKFWNSIKLLQAMLMETYTLK